ncbi:MAG: cytochrome c [Desulfuromonadales bacterium]
MRILLSLAMLLTAGSMLVMPIEVLAHGTEKHDHMVPTDVQMKKLHAMMPMFSLASANMETALEKGEIAVLESEAEKITAAIPELKKSKPHKNIKQRSKFVDHASNLEKAVMTTVDLAKKGDLVEAKAAYKKVEETCAACHAKFRD